MKTIMILVAVVVIGFVIYQAIQMNKKKSVKTDKKGGSSTGKKTKLSTN